MFSFVARVLLQLAILDASASLQISKVWKQTLKDTAVPVHAKLILPRIDCCLLCSIKGGCLGIFHNGKQCLINMNIPNVRSARNTGWEYWKVLDRSSNRARPSLKNRFKPSSARIERYTKSSVHVTGRLPITIKQISHQLAPTPPQDPKLPTVTQDRGQVTRAQKRNKFPPKTQKDPKLPSVTQVLVSRPLVLHTPQGQTARMIVAAGYGFGFYALYLKSGIWNKILMSTKYRTYVGQYVYERAGDRLFWTTKEGKVMWTKPGNLTEEKVYYKTNKEMYSRDMLFGLAIDDKSKLMFFTGTIRNGSDVTTSLMSIPMATNDRQHKIIASKRNAFSKGSYVTLDPKNKRVYAPYTHWHQILGCDYLGKACITYTTGQSAACMTALEGGEKVMTMGTREILTYEFSSRRLKRIKLGLKDGYASSFLDTQEGLVIITRKKGAFLYGKNKTLVPLRPEVPDSLSTVVLV